MHLHKFFNFTSFSSYACNCKSVIKFSSCTSRQSIDMYSSVHSPNLSFLGTPSLSRLSNSLLTNSFRGKSPEIISSLIKPLLPTSTTFTSDDHQQQQQEDIRKSSHYLPPTRKASSLERIPEDHRPMVGGHEVGPYRQCSYFQGVMNGK